MSDPHTFPEVDKSPIEWWIDSPSRHSIASCYLLQFWEKEKADSYNMGEVTISTEWMSCDHTFKSVANIGMVRSFDSRWVNSTVDYSVY